MEGRLLRESVMEAGHVVGRAARPRAGGGPLLEGGRRSAFPPLEGQAVPCGHLSLSHKMKENALGQGGGEPGHVLQNGEPRGVGGLPVTGAPGSSRWKGWRRDLAWGGEPAGMGASGKGAGGGCSCWEEGIGPPRRWGTPPSHRHSEDQDLPQRRPVGALPALQVVVTVWGTHSSLGPQTPASSCG